MPKTVITTDTVPRAIGAYSQAVRAGDLLFCSGLIALDAASGQMVGDGDVTAETHQVMANLRAMLAAAGASFADVVKTTIYLADLADYATVNQIYGDAVGSPPPARAVIEVARLPRDARLEIEAIARLG